MGSESHITLSLVQARRRATSTISVLSIWETSEMPSRLLKAALTEGGIEDSNTAGLVSMMPSKGREGIR